MATLLLTGHAQAQNNTSVVSQTGNSQSATVVQVGNANQSVIEQLTQTATTPNMGNVASTSQVATATGSEVNQAFIRQLNGSDYNQGSIRQSGGAGNRAIIEQNGSASYRGGGTQLFGSIMTPADPDAGNQASISQTGAGNGDASNGSITSVRQNAGSDGGSRANYARIWQVGNRNLSTFIDQNNLSVGNVATIDQGVGNGGATGNSAIVLQTDDSQRNRADITQEANGQTALVLQQLQSLDNRATVGQVGALGFANINQVDKSENNQATADQTTTAIGSYATINQTDQSYHNRAQISQSGSTDAALINQSTQSANNDALIRQGVGGTNNNADITQTYAYAGGSTGASTGLSGGNSATISQNQTTASSIGNTASIQQGFDGGLSPITNQVVISAGNQATISQENDVNVANVAQGGQQNQLLIQQAGNSTLRGVLIEPLLPNPAVQYGNTNVLIVSQAGTSGVPNMANISQIGNGNTATVGQIVPTP